MLAHKVKVTYISNVCGIEPSEDHDTLVHIYLAGGARITIDTSSSDILVGANQKVTILTPEEIE